MGTTLFETKKRVEASINQPKKKEKKNRKQSNQIKSKIKFLKLPSPLGVNKGTNKTHTAVATTENIYRGTETKTGTNACKLIEIA